MSNALTALSPIYWSKRMGRKLYKTDIFRSLASFEEQPTLTDGQKVDRPYRSDIVVENYTKGTALTAQDLTATDDQLTVDTVKAALMYVDNVDKIQNKYSAANAWIDEAGKRLSNAIDARFLYEVYTATNTVDDGSIGGTAGNGISVGVGNVLDVFAAVNLLLDVKNVSEDQRFFAVSPQFWATLWKYIAGKQSLLGDRTGQNGNVGQYANLQLFKTNNLSGSARFTTGDAGNVANTETITVNGITFTFVTAIGATAGNILIGASLSATFDNLVALITAGGVGDGVNNVSLSLANQRTVQNWIGVNNTTNVEIRAKGASYLTVSNSQAADSFAAATQLQDLLAGQIGSIDCVIQQEPSVEMGTTVSAGKSGMNILAMTLFGVYTFNQGRNQIVRVKVRSDAY